VYLAMLDLADPILRLAGVEPALARDVPLPGSRADQAWGLRPTNDGTLTLTVEYATALFEPATVSAWIERYLELLRTLLAQPDALLQAIDA
jgi:non-ribosomal peptide synthetase component F